MKKRFSVYSIFVLGLVLVVGLLIHIRFPGEMTPSRIGVLTLLGMACGSPILFWKPRGSPPDDDKPDNP